MNKEEITNIHIELRGVGQRYWNITMSVVPLPDNSGKTPCYADLVFMAEDVLREAKGLGSEWVASNAEVKARSSGDDHGILTPYRFRVTLDMVTKDMEAPTNEDV